ncbi:MULTISPECIES: cytidylate kinase family protein [unclassified Carboxylicivirga]|uniref:cytidylate kinase family protein n=1 Tax=Carboxylicivirga TaxID=1628153 RepID=UPI003D333C13
MKKNITISGLAGTGKSTVGKLLSEALGYSFVSVGNFSRELAKEDYNMTINEFQVLLSEKPELDNIIDDRFKNYCNKSDSLVIDYRLGFHFVKNASHILLTVSDDIAFNRIASSKRNDEDYSKVAIQKRNKQMKERFIKNFGVDFTDTTNYDLIIDTSFSSPEELVEKILSEFKALA